MNWFGFLSSALELDMFGLGCQVKGEFVDCVCSSSGGGWGSFWLCVLYHSMSDWGRVFLRLGVYLFVPFAVVLQDG